MMARPRQDHARDPRRRQPQAVLELCRDPGFTPGARHVVALIELWEGSGVDASTLRARRKSVVAALCRGDEGVARQLQGGLADVSGEQRAMRVRVLARIDRRTEVADLGRILLEGLRDSTPRVVREAARAVGKSEGLDRSLYEDALISVCEHAALPERRAAVEALGRIGGGRALSRLRSLAAHDDDLARRIAQATTLIERRAGRSASARVVGSRALPRTLPVVLRCRSGAAPIVADQAATVLSQPAIQRTVDLAIELRGDSAVELRWSGSLDELYRIRTAIDVALVFELPPGRTPADRIATALRRPDVVAALSAWTEGTVRFRLALADGGPRRAVVWQVARQLARCEAPLVNDSRGAPWTVEADEARGRMLCIPRGADPRFAYRRADVPAASHPSLAALLAWVGRPRAGDVVWDPFCGSGAELIECAMLQPDLKLWGTDLDPRAITAAEANFDASGVRPSGVRWQRADACTAVPPRDAMGVSLIVSNPPMGRRVARDGSVRTLLTRFVAHAAGVLAPSGRLVWVSPLPKLTADAGRSAGLEVEELGSFDMGGFVAAVQRMHKHA